MTGKAKVIRLDPELLQAGRTRMARLPAPIHKFHEAGKQFLVKQLELCFEAIDDALFDLADKAPSNQDQNTFFDAMREVRMQRATLEARFYAAIENALVELAGVAQSATDVAPLLKVEALSLVHNDDLEQLVAVESSVARATREHESLLRALTDALGRIVTNPPDLTQLPFGPTVLCQTALNQFKRLDIDIKAKLILFKLFDRHVIAELGVLNRELVNSLENSGILVSKASRSNDATTPTPTPKQAKTSDEKQTVSDWGAGLTPENRHFELCQMLSAIQKNSLNSPLTDMGGLDNTLTHFIKNHDSSYQISRVERETVNLVQMLFNFMLQNQGLADPFCKLVEKMQVPVLKMALLDQQFLTEKQHPARRLLNDFVAVASECKVNGHSKESEPLIHCMSDLVERILTRFDSDGDVFKEALNDFSAFVEKERHRSALFEKRTLDAEDGKARAELARKTVAEEVNVRMSAVYLPQPIIQFIKGPWSNVLFVTGLKSGFDSLIWVDQLQVLSDFIWSLQERSDKNERQKLIRLIPILIARLREGLESISYNPFEMADVLAFIADIHLARMRGEQPQAYQDQGESIPILEQAVMDETPPELAVESIDDAHGLVIANLSTGTWCDIQLTEAAEAVRCRFAAYLKATQKYIFVTRNGLKVAEKTKAELSLALKNGQFKLLDNTALFDRALETVVTAMRQNKNKGLLGLDNT